VLQCYETDTSLIVFQFELFLRVVGSGIATLGDVLLVSYHIGAVVDLGVSKGGFWFCKKFTSELVEERNKKKGCSQHFKMLKVKFNQQQYS